MTSQMYNKSKTLLMTGRDITRYDKIYKWNITHCLWKIDCHFYTRWILITEILSKCSNYAEDVSSHLSSFQLTFKANFDCHGDIFEIKGNNLYPNNDILINAIILIVGPIIYCTLSVRVCVWSDSVGLQHTHSLNVNSTHFCLNSFLYEHACNEVYQIMWISCSINVPFSFFFFFFFSNRMHF